LGHGQRQRSAARLRFSVRAEPLSRVDAGVNPSVIVLDAIISNPGATPVAAGAAARAVLRGGLRFLGGVAVGVAVGLVAGLAYAYLTRKQIEGDIANLLQNIPDAQRRKWIQP